MWLVADTGLRQRIEERSVENLQENLADQVAKIVEKYLYTTEGLANRDRWLEEARKILGRPVELEEVPEAYRQRALTMPIEDLRHFKETLEHRLSRVVFLEHCRKIYGTLAEGELLDDGFEHYPDVKPVEKFWYDTSYKETEERLEQEWESYYRGEPRKHPGETVYLEKRKDG